MMHVAVLRNALQKESILNIEQKGKTSWAVLPGLALSPWPPSFLLDALAASQWESWPLVVRVEQVLINPALSRPSNQTQEDFVQITLPIVNQLNDTRAKQPSNLQRREREGLAQIFPCIANCSKERRQWLCEFVSSPYSCQGAQATLSNFLALGEQGYGLTTDHG